MSVSNEMKQWARAAAPDVPGDMIDHILQAAFSAGPGKCHCAPLCWPNDPGCPVHSPIATTCPGHGRSECVSCCWPKGELEGKRADVLIVDEFGAAPSGHTAVDVGTAAADGYRDGKANPELQMHHVALALESVRGGPVMTSNQCYDLARALNGIQRDRVK